ncbi:MAG TPA: prephenate dehydrogenase/arogenate dehydrogenase family protein [Capsulimonadaceae bacterium]|nr:prephenate dehydrogenase/arogenate dehydrogenase family protein [Capsulimonadaceae bacterium]
MSSEDDFGTVAIVGVGLIGGSLGMALKRRRRTRAVVGVGRNPDHLELARRLEAIDTWSTDTPSALAEADTVILCTPVGKIIEDLPAALAACKPSAVVTDAGSVKSPIVNASAGDPRFVGSHPMAGSERAGVEAAYPTLFEEATWALTPTASTDPQTLKRVAALAHHVGASTLILEPSAHDAAVAVTSHLPHVMAWSLMRLAHGRACRDPHVARMAAGSFADMTRVAAASPDLWQNICLANKEALLAAIEEFRSQLEEAAAALKKGDAKRLEEFFAEGVSAKKSWQQRDQ